MIINISSHRCHASLQTFRLLDFWILVNFRETEFQWLIPKHDKSKNSYSLWWIYHDMHDDGVLVGRRSQSLHLINYYTYNYLHGLSPDHAGCYIWCMVITIQLDSITKSYPVVDSYFTNKIMSVIWKWSFINLLNCIDYHLWFYNTHFE